MSQIADENVAVSRGARRIAIEPRGLCRKQAAAYIGVSPAQFDKMIRDGRMPWPKRIDRRTVWDREKIDAAFEDIPGDGPAFKNDFDE
jgi:predicted DNA-binding transcriptional regulator AlpA